MKLIWLSDNSLENKQFPWLAHIHWLSGLLPTTTCDVCGREGRYQFQGPICADAEGGSKWPDILNGDHPGPPLVITERVKDALENANASGVTFGSIQIKRVEGMPPADAVAPRYFYLNVSGRLDIDLDGTGIPYSGICRGCGMCFMRREDLVFQAERFIPRVDSWDGGDFCMFRNIHYGYLFCSERILLLARNQRWTNCRFAPIDVLHRHYVGWNGIDYLGKQWPPKWYPDPPHQGKSPDQWANELQSDDPARSYAAIKAFKEIGPAGVPHLIDVLKRGNEAGKRDAANLLDWLRRNGATVPEEALPLLEL